MDEIGRKRDQQAVDTVVDKMKDVAADFGNGLMDASTMLPEHMNPDAWARDHGLTSEGACYTTLLGLNLGFCMRQMMRHGLSKDDCVQYIRRWADLMDKIDVTNLG